VESGRAWLVEQRYRAVLEVLGGAPVAEVAVRYGTSRQSVYAWKRRYQQHGLDGLTERSRRPRTSPRRLAAEVEALVCELRRAHPRWGARRLSFELAQRGVSPAPSRATVHRTLVRNGLVTPHPQQHRRTYKRWQRDAPMQLWQLDLIDAMALADGRECKVLTGVDDHSRYCVIARVLLHPTCRAVCACFAEAMRRYGVPGEVLTDNGKQFTGRFTKPRPAEVLFERICRENGITARLTKPRSPTTTGKVERFHQTLRRELLDTAGPFADLASAQAALDAWVDGYNHRRPHQALGMATPASRFLPAAAPSGQPAAAGLPLRLPTPGSGEAAAAPRSAAHPAGSAAGTSPLALVVGPGAVEFDALVPASGLLNPLPSGQRIRLSPAAAFAGRTVTIWADERSLHVLLDGHLVRTVASKLTLTDLEQLTFQGARPAGPPPAIAALPGGSLPPAAVVEVERSVDQNGVVDVGGQALKVGTRLAGRRVTLRLDGHLVHVIDQGVLARTLPSPIPAPQRARLRGARLATTPLPPPPRDPLQVQRRVPRDGRVMVARQLLRVGATHAGKVVTVVVEDTCFRVLCDGEELAAHPRTSDHPITRFKAYAPRGLASTRASVSRM
jgi:transposase InsO family protein